ncbi:MAG: dihydropteroate synthase family protein [Eubacterium sp.]|nr:dihydropteroate synthase family protein [Eubacterium sp.]
MNIGNKEFDFDSHRVYVMGILNVTPDSFSDGGEFNNIDAALKHVEQMIKEGADIIDVGGESTRPGHQQISAEEESARVSDVISHVKSHFDIPVSIDTYKAPVARAAIDAGADVLNDIWGFRYERFNEEDAEIRKKHEVPEIAKIAAEAKIPVILMYNDNLGRDINSRDEKTITRFLEANQERSAVELLNSVKEENVADRIVWGLRESIRIAHRAGIKKDSIIVDPGIGFAKTQKENLLTMKYLKKIVGKVGYPMLLATSRKSMIGNALDLPVDQREEGTIVTTILGAEAGCNMVRVHDVVKNVRALKMLYAINE